MQKKDQLLLINRICDEFEAKLQLDSSTDIKRTLESTSTELVDQGLVKNLLVELISLKIAYSENRDATAKSLKERYPEYVVPAQRATPCQWPPLNHSLRWESDLKTSFIWRVAGWEMSTLATTNQ